jgi:hypothetical protein
VQRPLRERREGADLLDLVSEEVDPERLAAGRGEDVDDPAAYRQLSSLLGPFDTLVARQGEVLCDRFDPPLVPDGQPQRLGASFRRRHGLRQRDGRRTHQPAACQDLERAGPLADEMWRGLEAGFESHTAAGEERDAVLAEKPGGRLGRIAGVGVLRQQTDEAALELVEAGQDERQGGLRDARIGLRARLDEVMQPPLLEELVDQHVKNRTVHDERPEAALRGRNGTPAR